MRASIFTLQAGQAAVSLTVNSPSVVLPAIGPSTFGSFSYGGGVLRANSLTPGGFTQAYVGHSVTSSNIAGFPTSTVTAVTDSNDIVINVPGSPSLLIASNSSAITVSGSTTVFSLPVGTTVIPVVSTAGVEVGDVLGSGGGIPANAVITAIGTTTTGSGAMSPAITISLPTNAVIATGASLSIPAQPSLLVYPVDQYIAPVELSIQTLSVGGGSVTVQATTVPLSEIDGPYSAFIWGQYQSDGGSATLPSSVGGINVYSNKVVTAVRFVNAGTSPVTVSLAEAGIIS